MTTPADLVARIAALLDRLGIPYHVGGSVASSWYGEPRTTADLDVVIEADAPRLEALASALAPDFYVASEALGQAVRSGGSFNAIALDAPFKIDFFLLGSRAFDREEFRRAAPRSLGTGGEGQVRLKSPEDLVLRKLEWYRLGGGVSDRQWRDVLGILSAMSGRLDDAYLDRWATDLGLTDLLARVRRDAPGT